MSVYYHAPTHNRRRGPKCFRDRVFTHLTADTESELVRFATKRLRMRAKRLQQQGTPRFHFDVTGTKLAFLLLCTDAEEVSREEFVRRMRARM